MRPLMTLLALCAAAGAAQADDGWLGVQLQADDAGVVVDEVIDDSPAAKGGLAAGDVIVAFQGQPIEEVKDLTKAVRKADPGDEVTVTVRRDGQQRDLKVELGDLDERRVLVIRRDDKGGGGDDDDKDFDFEVFAPQALRQGAYLGIGMQDLTGQLATYFGVEDGRGVLVSEVKDASPAAAAGLEAGDVIVKVGDVAVADGGDLREALGERESGDEVALQVIRKGQTRTHTVKLADWPQGEGRTAMDGRAWPRMREFMPDLRQLRELRMAPHGEQRDELRAELDQLRRELDELRQELQDQR